jgi:hypothetical protein
MYIDFKAGNKEYKLRLTTRNIMSLEKNLGCNPLMIFGNGDKIPEIAKMVAILHASLQSYHHNITMDEACDIFDAYLLDGNSMTDFMNVIVEIFKTSGIIPDKVNTIEKN